MAKNKIDFKAIEDKWRTFWEKENIYKFDSNNPQKIFSVDTPPPTVSGEMHIGHAFSYAQQDFIVRFQRMFLGNVYYPFGTDDNGLPTERLIERLKKVKSRDMSRADFIKLCLTTLKEITPKFIQDWKDLGISCDYSTYYSTINPATQKISQKYFIDLVKKKEAYKKNFPTIWCPECQTAIAQAELEDKEKTTELSYIKGKMEDGSFIIYATTRPELHPGCIGISINKKGDYVKVAQEKETWIISKDAVEEMNKEFPMKVIKNFKGKDLIGKRVDILFAEQPIFVSHDESAKTEYGTGIVYYCSYGGLDCVQWLGRHPDAKAIPVMDESGRYTKGPAKGLRSNPARKKILELLEKENYLIKNKKLKHVVNTHDKCGTPIEFVETEQWFIKILDKKKKLIAQGRKVKWYPEYMRKRYENWVNGLEWDWSVSRNRHFGIPLPIWYCHDCNEVILPDEKELPVDPLQINKKCSKCGKGAVGEKMVLDTWATSSLTPQIASNLIKDKIDLPLSLRPQAHDIIRTWAFYTIARGLLHENKIPWKDIIISGNVSMKGEKMSKSKGNVIDPKKVIEEYGSDALRFWAAGSKLGNDLDYQEKDLITGKKTINKLLNASRFVFMNLEGYKGGKPKELEALDTIFLNRLNYVINEASLSFEKYEYSKAKQEVEQFFWKDFCDNYLEIVKKRVYQGTGDAKLSAQYTLHTSLLAILKMFAPIMPFITEEIYQEHFKKLEKDKSIHISAWPKVSVMKVADKKFDIEWDKFLEVLSKVRQEKTKAGKAMNSEINLELVEKDYVLLKLGLLDDLKNVVNAREIVIGKEFGVVFYELEKK